MNRNRWIAILSGIALGAAVGGAFTLLWESSPVAYGLVVQGARVPDDMELSVWVRTRAVQMATHAVHLHAGDNHRETTWSELGISVDELATLASIRAFGHHGSLLQRIRERMQARRGEAEIPFVFSVDEQKLKAFLAELKVQVDRPAVDARMDIANYRKIPDVAGQSLHIEESMRVLHQAATCSRDVVVHLVVESNAAKVTIDNLADIDISKMLSSNETHFVTWGVGVGRSANIRNAASKIDGTIIAPGEVFSFNDKVGPRTRENGFVLAPEIQGDELVPGYGGGTCQVSSTLHAAALFGAMEIVDRRSHSRVSSYTKMGLDATVSYPAVDLKIRNPMSFPVMIHAYLPKPTVIRMEILGGDPVAKVDYAYGIGKVEDFMRRVKVMPYLEPGKKIRHQKGARGYDVTSTVKVHYMDGRTEERHYFSGYRASPEIYWVAPGTVEEDMPPLPEHAKGVENKLSETSQSAGSVSM